MQSGMLATNAEAVRRVEAHTRSEYTNDIDQIMATVGSQVCYVLPDLGADDVVLVAVTERDQVRDAYVRERELLDIVRSRHLAELTSERFVFYDSLATTRARESGEEVNVNSAVLFPVLEDGIVGELLWSRGSLGSGIRASVRDSGSSVVAGEGAADDLSVKAANYEAHDEFLTAWRKSDAARLAECFDESCQWMTRDHRQSGTAVTRFDKRIDLVEWYSALFDELRVSDVLVLQRLVASWYVYAEYAVTSQKPDGSTARTRVGAIHPVVRPGSFAGLLAFEFAEE